MKATPKKFCYRILADIFNFIALSKIHIYHDLGRREQILKVNPMAYYGYHQRIKQRIQNGELVDCYLAENYPRIGQALVLVFNTVPFLRPIRPYRWPEYREVLREKGFMCPECA